MEMMPTDIDMLLEANEAERLEFKEARHDFDSRKLEQYGSVLANEGGGRIVLGVTDRRPRRVVGSQAYLQPEDRRKDLRKKLGIAVDFAVVAHPAGRVLVFEFASRPAGLAVRDSDGVAWVRGHGDELVPMSDARHRLIWNEVGFDFSADVCTKAEWADLNPAAIEEFRSRWIRRERAVNAATAERLSAVPPEQLLADAELTVDGRLTYAALILFGTRPALGRHLGQAEIICEYRSTEASGEPSARPDAFREGYFAVQDRIWEFLNQRNDTVAYRGPLGFEEKIPTFDELSVREVLLNAVCHRNYQLAGNVFVRQYPQRLEVDSPGGLPPSVTVENILDRSVPRNRRLADAFRLCGLVHRSGQGMNIIFEKAVRQSKPLPDLSRTDDSEVRVTLFGEVHDPAFVEFLELVSREKQIAFTSREWLLLSRVARGESLSNDDRKSGERLLESGLVERIARGKFGLPRRYSEIAGRRGEYTRTRGLSREGNRRLLAEHIQAFPGSQLAEFQQLLPSLTVYQIQGLLYELRDAGEIHNVGKTRASKWFPGPTAPEV